MLTTTPKQLQDMSKSDIIGKYKTTTIKHFDGNERTVYYSDIEVPFPKGEKVVSVTNEQGIIVNANSTFVQMSGYSRSELMGAPHYILHHPDMPKAAFKDLWTSLREKNEWSGYVKNLRKDGGYYWVFAKIFTLYRDGKVSGYTSTRTGAEPDKIAYFDQEYRNMLVKES
ncbi:MAG: PAS domain-containing protein [Gammaproteobacteria bacterium]|nr:PAS domain-containing protein [Gammaproteobacteria bacterium]